MQQFVDRGDGGAAATGDALPAPGVEQLRPAPFLGRHAQEDRFRPLEPGFRLCRIRKGRHAGHHAKQILHRPKFSDLAELAEHVVQPEGVAADFVFERRAVEGGGGFGRLLDQAHNVAHAKDAPRQARGVHALELIGLFAGAKEMDGQAGDVAHRNGGAAAGIAVQPGQDEAGEGDGGVEALDDFNGFLAKGGVGNEEDLLRAQGVADAGELAQEGVVEVEASGGIDDDGVPGDAGGLGKRGGGEGGGVFGGAVGGDGDVEGAGERFELVDGGGALEVGGDEEGVAPVALEPGGEFGGGGGLPAALEAAEEDAEGGAGRKGRGIAQEPDEFIVEDLHHLLAGRDALEDLGAEGAGLDRLDQFAGDLEMDIRFEEGHPELAAGVGDVGLGEFAEAAEIAEDVLEAVGELVEHGIAKDRGSCRVAGRMKLGKVSTAFVLCAGLGTRLRPLTDTVPKPLLPVGGRPLLEWILEHLRAHGIERVILNTHHLAHRFEEAFPGGQWRGMPVVLRHEPVILDSGGGLKNVEDLLGGETALVYNGDILTDMPLAGLWEEHARAGHEVTLALRSRGTLTNVGVDGTGRVVDIRGARGAAVARQCQFAGIYLVEPAFLGRLPAGRAVSVIPHFLALIEEGRLGSVVEDRGRWAEIGSLESYAAVKAGVG